MLLKKTSKIADIQSRSETVIDLFRKTSTDLTRINMEIDREQENRSEQITALQLEISSLDEIKKRNSKFADKLNNFLNVD